MCELPTGLSASTCAYLAHQHLAAQAPARAVNPEGPTSPGGVKRLMDLDALSGEIDDGMDGGADSEMPSAEAGTTMTPDTTGEVASALGVLTGAAQAVGGLVSSLTIRR